MGLVAIFRTPTDISPNVDILRVVPVARSLMI
jgi:hypothetical protein